MKYLILILIPFISFSQVEVPEEYWLDDSNFEQAISSGAFGDDNESTIVIEFWAKFNEENCFAEWDKLEEAKYYRVDIAETPITKKEYRVRMAPTILIFKNGVVEQAFKAGLDLLLPTDLEEIQNAIHEINAASNF
jgi:hypothetical protein